MMTVRMVRMLDVKCILIVIIIMIYVLVLFVFSVSIMMLVDRLFRFILKNFEFIIVKILMLDLLIINKT